MRLAFRYLKAVFSKDEYRYQVMSTRLQSARLRLLDLYGAPA